MSLLKAMDTRGSGLAAQRIRMNLVSTNLANANTTRTVEGGPYRKKIPVSTAVITGADRESFDQALEQVQVAEIKRDDGELPQLYDPSHPDADPETGMVTMPNINVVEEMVELTTAARSYEASVTAFEALKQMVNKAMELGR